MAQDPLEKELKKLEKKLKNTRPVMKQWGAILVESSQRAFMEQRFGDKDWSAKYEGSKPPFINLAGALEDFNAGKFPSQKRFQDRPALVSSGHLKRSVTFKVVSKTEVAHGTNREYGILHQEGGQSRQIVTQGAKDKMTEWLFGTRKSGKVFARKSKTKVRKGQIAEFTIMRKDGKVKKTRNEGEAKRARKAGHVVRRGSAGPQTTQAVGRQEFKSKIIGLRKKNVLITNIEPRPFLGVTDSSKGKMIQVVKDHFEDSNGNT